jgi:hypothetical protein
MVFVDFKALAQTRTDSLFLLEVRPMFERLPRRQLECCRVQGGLAAGVVELGSSEWPLRHDQEYTFGLTALDGSLISDGKVITKVHAIATLPPWILVFLGVLASIIQILQVGLGWNPDSRTPQRRERTSRQHRARSSSGGVL